MASSINAITTGSGGVITTADNSGVLNLQSGGTTVAAITSSGLNVVGTLTVNGAAPTSGKVLQVVSYQQQGTVNASSTTFAATNKGTLAITTISATSKILCLLTFGPSPYAGSDGQVTLRSSIDSYVSNLSMARSYIGTNGANGCFTSSINYLHTHGQSAGTTITYKSYFNSLTGTFSLGDYWNNTGLEGSYFTTTLMEIAA